MKWNFDLTNTVNIVYCLFRSASPIYYLSNAADAVAVDAAGMDTNEFVYAQTTDNSHNARAQAPAINNYCFGERE